MGLCCGKTPHARASHKLVSYMKPVQISISMPEQPPPCEYCKMRPRIKKGPLIPIFYSGIYRKRYSTFYPLCAHCSKRNIQAYNLKLLEAGCLSFEQLYPEDLPPGVFEELLRPKHAKQIQPTLFDQTRNRKKTD